MKKEELVGRIAVLQDMINGATNEQISALTIAIDALIQVKAFEDGERSKWIPVEKRLPEVYEVEIKDPGMMAPETFLFSRPVFVTGRRNKGPLDDPPVLVGRFEKDDDTGRTFWQDLDCWELVDVSAWQPLPEPYGGKK